MNNKFKKLSGKILVIANSGRMLAQFLRNAGYEVVVVDCFADLDTRELASDFVQVPSLALENIKNPLRTLQSRHQLAYVIYGSGFEKQCDSVQFLESCLTVLGNCSVTFTAIQDKAGFFEQLDKLSIDYPEVSFRPPQDRSAWLSKPLHGEGGVGVSRYSAKQDDVKQVYWQRFIDGVPLSVLFLAGKEKVSIVGFQRQLMSGSPNREFLFSGVISQPDLPADCRSLVIDWVTELSACYQLTGLNSLDFIFRDQQCYALEINARPAASLQLYDPSVIAAHIKACLGEFGEITYNSAFFQAYRIIYAKFDLVNRNRNDWPDWAMDRPVVGSKIAKGEPVCSIVARAETSRQVMDCLHFKQQAIENLFKIGIKNNAIRSKCK